VILFIEKSGYVQTSAFLEILSLHGINLSTTD